MKKTVLFFALLLVVVATGFAQIDQQFLVAGENNAISKLQKINGKNNYIGRDETGSYFSRIHNEKLRFYHVDNSGKEDLQGPGIKVTMESRRYRYIESVMLDGNIYVLSVSNAYEAKKYTVHAHAVNLKTLKDDSKPVVIGSGDILPTAKDFSKYYVRIKQTPSGKKMFLFCLDLKGEEIGPVNTKMTLFDSKLNPEYELSYVTEASEKEELIVIPRVLDESTAFVEIQKSEKSEDKQILKSRILRHYGKQGLIKEVGLDVEKAKNVDYLEMHQVGKKIWLTSMYYPKERQWRDEEENPEGLVNILWDTDLNKITEFIRIPCHKLGVKEPAGNLGVMKLITHEDGSFTVFAEGHFVQFITVRGYLFGQMVYKDLYVFRFSEKGTLVWNKTISKKQEYLLEQSGYGSFFAFEKGDKVVILYNDDKTKMPRFVTINKEGKLTEEGSQNNELSASDVVPRLSSKINDNYFVIYTFVKEKNAYRLVIYDKRK